MRAWAAAAGGAPAGVSDRLRDAAEDLAVAADRRPADLPGAVRRFGWQAGADGWPLDEIARWVEALANSGGGSARALLTFDAGMALSAGWADGFLHGADQDDCIDPTSGLARLGVLQLRLQQVYDHCASLGIQPDLVYALVVVDASLDEHPPLERNAARVALAGGDAGSSSRPARPIAIHDDRVLVLASRTPELADRVAILGAALHTHGLLRHDPVSAWVERLPADAADLRAFLADLTA